MNSRIKTQMRPAGNKTGAWASQLLLAMALIMVTGCEACYWMMYPKHPQQYGRYLDLGSARRIAQETLKQTQEREILLGTSALAAAGGELRGANDPDEAEKGFRQIYAKLLAGWPGFEASDNSDSDPYGHLPADRTAAHLEMTLRGIYSAVTQGYVENAEGLLREWEVSAKANPGRYAAWKEAGKFLVPGACTH